MRTDPIFSVREKTPGNDETLAAEPLNTSAWRFRDRLVIAGAQTLLSEEFKSRNEADTN